MAKKKRNSIEYRYYEIGQDEYVLALFGESWVRDYGRDVDGLHFHNLTEIGVCHEGHGEMVYEGGSYPYHPGTLTIIPKNIPHVTISEEGKQSFWEYLFFDPAQIVREVYPDDEVFCRQVLEQLDKTYLMLTQDGCRQLSQLIELLIYEMEHKEKHYKRVTKGLMEALVMEIYRLYTSEKSKQRTAAVSRGTLVLLREALDYIGDNYMDPGLRIEQLAQLCGLSETHFRRIFKEQMHIAPSEYINLVRIQQACELMRKSHMSMGEISDNVGFESTTSFTRNFKKFLDITPYQWKKHPENYEGKILDYNVSVLRGW